MVQEIKKSYWIQAVTSLHSGIGRGLGYIDTPIAREKVTNWPYVPASSVKGVLRDYYEDKFGKNNDKVINAFGSNNDSTKDKAGALVFTDAKLVCLPVRSLYGTFAWVCSVISLNRIKRDLELACFDTSELELSAVIETQGIIVTQNSKLKNTENKVYLEDLDLEVKDDNIENIANFLANKIFEKEEDKKIFKERFAIVSEEVFNFLCETGTEVIAHNRISDETKVTASGALWYEETLPPETILFGFVWQQSFCKEDLNCFCDSKIPLQIGGKSSVGKGQIICNFK